MRDAAEVENGSIEALVGQKPAISSFVSANGPSVPVRLSPQRLAGGQLSDPG
jgi:hypothetical protein